MRAFSHHISHGASFFCRCVISCAIFPPTFHIRCEIESVFFFDSRRHNKLWMHGRDISMSRNNIERRGDDLKMRTVNVPAEIIHEISLVFRVAPLPCYLRERGMYLFDIYYETFFCCRAARRCICRPHPHPRPCAH